MTLAINNLYGSWESSTPPFTSKYGVFSGTGITNKYGVLQDPYGNIFSPSELFASGAPGVWYDLSLTDGTLFQDAAGTTPVTAVEQPVGLVLDKSKGLVLGPELVTNGDFSSSTRWTTGAGWTISGGKANYDGIAAATNIRQTITANNWQEISFTISGITSGQGRLIIYTGNTTAVVWGNTNVQNGTYTFKSRVPLAANIDFFAYNSDGGSPRVAFSIDNISVRELPGNHAFQTTSANRSVLSARHNQFVGTETLATQSLATLAATYLLRFEGTGSITLSGTATGTYTAGVYSVTCTAGTLTATVAGSVTKADLRVANDGVNLPPYQRVNTATDYDTAGFPLYLRFNGSTQFLQTNSIDFSSTDKVLVAAGVRKLSDAAAATVAELSANSGVTPNTFAMFAPSVAAPNYAFRSSGTSNGMAVATTFASPVTNVLVGLGEVASDTAILRINGAQAASSTADQGAGNLGFHPLYIGARAGTSLFFNGRLYSLIIAGIKPTDAQILGVETYINSLTKAF